MRIFFLSQVFRKIDIWNFKVQKAIQEQQQLIVESRSQVAKYWRHQYLMTRLILRSLTSSRSIRWYRWFVIGRTICQSLASTNQQQWSQLFPHMFQYVCICSVCTFIIVPSVKVLLKGFWAWREGAACCSSCSVTDLTARTWRVDGSSERPRECRSRERLEGSPSYMLTCIPSLQTWPWIQWAATGNISENVWKNNTNEDMMSNDALDL